MKILYVVTEDWAFLHHRLQIARAVRDAGFEVIAVSSPGDRGEEVRDLGFEHETVLIDRRNLNPLKEPRTILELTTLYRRLQPSLVHHFAFKPIVHGSIAARASGLPAVVNSITGLGYVFTSDGLKRRMLRGVTESAFRYSLGYNRAHTIFQNREDLEFFVARGLAHPSRSHLIRGSGVDLSRFSAEPESEGEPTILLASRMLWDKGIRELVEASRLLRSRGLAFRVSLVGSTDPENPTSIPESQLRSWQEEGAVEWLGYRQDIDALLKASHVACLPSYREGLPLFLLEAAASGRAIVSTDTTGCREAVTHGENGLLVPPRDSAALADALEALIVDAELRRSLGDRGVEVARQEFSVERVASQTIALYESLIGAPA